MCKSTIEQSLLALDGVKEATLDLETKAVTVKFKGKKVSADDLRTAISQSGYQADSVAPDAAAQALLDQGMAARSSYDFLRAIDKFDRLVAYCPDYAEGYNQRAFVNFLREDFSAALIDLDLALERSPSHVGALSGKALTLMGLGQMDAAQVVLREALALNPWIPERGLLQPEPGEDI